MLPTSVPDNVSKHWFEPTEPGAKFTASLYHYGSGWVSYLNGLSLAGDFQPAAAHRERVGYYAACNTHTVSHI